jgi:hypothetical protein
LNEFWRYIVSGAYTNTVEQIICSVLIKCTCNLYKFNLFTVFNYALRTSDYMIKDPNEGRLMNNELEAARDSV